MTRQTKATKAALHRRSHRGFTLIELMIVVPIIGILAALAVPQYQDYMARTQFAEGLTLASAQKAAVVEAVSENGVCPNNVGVAVAGIPSSVGIQGRYVANVQVGGTLTDSGGCTITATFRGTKIAPALSGQTVTLTLGDIRTGSVTWECKVRCLRAVLAEHLRHHGAEREHLKTTARKEL